MLLDRKIPFSYLFNKIKYDLFSNLPTDTPVTAIARTVDINIRQLLGEKEIPPPAAPEKFYLM